jgi:hypothetical protein
MTKHSPTAKNISFDQLNQSNTNAVNISGTAAGTGNTSAFGFIGGPSPSQNKVGSGLIQ